MRIIEYRKVPFVDREKEEKWLLERFSQEPAKILFIYGPKSSGKTTLMEYLVENVLKKDKSLYVNYVNFRGYAIVNYDSFLDVYFQPIEDENKPFIEKALEYLPISIGRFGGNVSLPIKGIQFGLNIELYDRLVEKKIDPFNLLLEILKKIRKKQMPILILDEVQILEGIYMNGEVKRRHLLTEFFNFLVRLTKETHLAHVVVMTSETLFLEKIYNHSKLAKTSDFYLIDHFDKETVRKWFEQERIYEESLFDLIWDYFGGAASDLVEAIRLIQENKIKELEEYLLNQTRIYRGKMAHFIAENLQALEEKRMFQCILEEMLKQGFVVRDIEDNLQIKILNKAIEHEFLFLDPADEKIIFNSQIVKKGAEMYLGKSGE